MDTSRSVSVGAAYDAPVTFGGGSLEEFSRLLFDQSREGMVMVDIQTERLVRVNPQILRMLGYAQAEMVDRPIWDFIVPDHAQEARAYYAKLMQENIVLAPGVAFRRKDGSVLFTDICAVKIAELDRAYGLGVFRDMTARLEAESRLHHLADDLRRSNEDLEQLAVVASHDMKEPLRMITAFLGLLRDRCRNKLDPTAFEYIQYVEDAGKRMQRLVDDLLDYSRIGRDRPCGIVDLDAVMEEAVNNLRATILEVGASVTRDPLPLIRAHRIDMTRVFQNLIGNSIKFRRKDVPPRIHVSARRAGENWRFEVSDNGIGIAPEYRAQLFQIFRRLHDQDAYPGTGIGLAVCKKIVERHGGTIGVESNPEGGCVFTFQLPA